MVEVVGEDERELVVEMVVVFFNENFFEFIFGVFKVGNG